MDKLLFGTAGIPTIGKNIKDGIEQVKKLNLDAMEVEFVRGVYLKKESSEVIGNLARKNNIVLTCHAPYYINLNSPEKAKLEASKKRILDSARMACFFGGWSLTFHPGFYLKLEKESVFQKVKKEIRDMRKKMDDEGLKIWLRPETMGRQSQFGEVDEILRLSQEIEGVMPCVDFAHIYARHPEINTFEKFSEILEKVESSLGKEGLKNMHIHFAGIEYNSSGETHHTILKDSKFNFTELVKTWQKFRIKGVAISESPNLEKDAILVKKLFLDR